MVSQKWIYFNGETTRTLQHTLVGHRLVPPRAVQFVAGVADVAGFDNGACGGQIPEGDDADVRRQGLQAFHRSVLGKKLAHPREVVVAQLPLELPAHDDGGHGVL